MTTTTFDPEGLDLKVGLEVHQQLATNKKLFCGCRMSKKPGLEIEIERQLRPTQSELGRIDEAALFESKLARIIRYKVDANSACLVEIDEEPPHDLNQEALEIALTIALLLESRPVDELHVMRKIVIDGSNTTGFQRTLVVALGGELKVGSRVVPVQAVSLEEDAARIIGKSVNERIYSLDRVCTPLIEVALAPVTCSFSEIATIAVTLGRLMRSTGKVARGLGTVRQDVNVSIRNGNVIEVKGVQKLNLIPKIVEFEGMRQSGMIMIAQELRKRGLDPKKLKIDVVDLTALLEKTTSQVLRRILDIKGSIFGAKLEGFEGILGYEPFDGIRLGSELADIARANGHQGILHSDELPGYGISESEVSNIRSSLSTADNDAFILLAGLDQDLEATAIFLENRIKEAYRGPPAETRSPTDDGKTRFSRPRPGAARMYPETDIFPIPVRDELLAKIKDSLPPTYSSQIDTYISKYHLSPKLAKQVFDSDRQRLFDEIVNTSKVAGSIVATALTETIVSLEREGSDTSMINDDHLSRLFNVLGEGRIAKEAVPEILRVIAGGHANTIDKAIQTLSLSKLGSNDLEEIIRKTVEENDFQVTEHGKDSFGALMGKIMLEVRGKADGKEVSSILKKVIGEMVTSSPS